MKLYIQTVNDAGEIEGVYEPMVTCEECVFFKRLSDDRLRRPYICTNPDGMVNPTPDGWCSNSYGRRTVSHE